VFRVSAVPGDVGGGGGELEGAANDWKISNITGSVL